MGVFAGETFSYKTSKKCKLKQQVVGAGETFWWTGTGEKKHGGFADHGGFKKPHRISTACGQTLMIHPGSYPVINFEFVSHKWKDWPQKQHLSGGVSRSSLVDEPMWKHETYPLVT